MDNGYAAAAAFGLAVLWPWIIVGILVGALILMLATKLVEKFTPSYGKAIVAVIAGFIASFIVKLILHFILPANLLSGLISAVVGFLVTAWVIMKMILRPSGEAMPYSRACLIALVEWVIGVFIIVLILGGLMLIGMHH
ncbi:MAG: hypothetical protein ACREPZ_07480 [Rhodanobacteraceae bacterium]